MQKPLDIFSINHPIIKDTNGNGQLDGAELIAQLKAEEQAQGLRTASEAVHGVLEIVGVRDLKQQMEQFYHANKAAFDAQPELVDTLLTQATDRFVQATLGTVENALENPNEMRAKMNELLTSQHAPAEVAKLLRGDMERFIQFAQGFQKEFPKGMAIKNVEIAEILGHFKGPLQVPATLPPLPEDKAPTR